MNGCEDEIGVMTPTESMANILCDFQEIMWSSSTRFVVTINNWGTEPVTLTKDQQVGSVEPAVLVSEDDPVWEDSETQVLMCQTRSMSERYEQLKEQLQIGAQLAPQERDQMEQMLLAQLDVFALSDEELGKTDLISHSIDTGDAKPVKTLPHRLPYTLRKELEEEMIKLEGIACIEPSNSPYASPLVLVRRKNGGL